MLCYNCCRNIGYIETIELLILQSDFSSMLYLLESWIVYYFPQTNYDHFDGFVILHGTDTMSYTASALSFMLENLGKPVILTGSQVITLIHLSSRAFELLISNTWLILKEKLVFKYLWRPVFNWYIILPKFIYKCVILVSFNTVVFLNTRYSFFTILEWIEMCLSCFQT